MENVTISNVTSNNDGESACLNLFDSLVQCEWLKRCKKISASLSVIGCLFTIFIIWLFKKYGAFAQRMIIHLCIATLFQAIFYLLVDIEIEATTICKIQGALLQYISWVILLWILSIIMNLLWNVKCIRYRMIEKYEVHISVFCWGLPVIIAALPFADDAYAPSGAWCWYKNSIGWMFGTWYAWSMMSFIFIFVSIAYITYKLRASSRDVVGTFDADYNRRKKSIREAVRTLRLYPIAYFLVILIPTIDRLQNVIIGSPEHHESNFVLVLLHCLTDPIDGAVITLVFVMDKRTRQILKLKHIWEALKRKFQPELEIHELILKSKLSRSDYIIAARMSIASIEGTGEGTIENRMNKTKVSSNGALEAIRETESACNYDITSRGAPGVSWYI